MQAERPAQGTCGGMADTVDLGSTAKAWGFESLQVHQGEKFALFNVPAENRLSCIVGAGVLKVGKLGMMRFIVSAAFHV